MEASKSFLVNVVAVSFTTALLMLPTATHAVDFYRFGTSEGDTTLAKTEDAAVMISLTNAPFMVYGESYTQISVGRLYYGTVVTQ